MNRDEILHTDSCWSTSDEINVIDYIASPKRIIAHDSEKVSDVKIKVTVSNKHLTLLTNYTV